MSLCLRGEATRSVFLGKAQFVLQSVLFGSVLMVRGERHGKKTNPEKALLTVDLTTVGHLFFWSLAISLWLCLWMHRLRRFIYADILLIGIVRWFSVLHFWGLAVSLLIHNSECGWFTCPYLLCHLAFKDVWWWGCLTVSRTERLKWPNFIPMELFEAEICKTPHKVWMW